MARQVNSERVLTVLYDLALVIGGETRLASLLERTLQRLLYHTAFPAGFVALRDTEGALRIAAAVGDHRLQSHVGDEIQKPSIFCAGANCQISSPQFFTRLPCAQNRYKHCLCLSIDHIGDVFLLSSEEPSADLPIAQVFQPIMNNFGAAIRLCRNNEAYLESLEASRRHAEENLRESEARLQTLFSNMHEGIALCELVHDDAGQAIDYRVVDCNPSCVEILGKPRDAIVAQLGSVLVQQSPVPYLQQLASVVRLNTPFFTQAHYEPTNRELSLSAVPWIRNGFAWVIDDVTEAHRLRERLEWAASYDKLTQLPNRMLLDDRMQQALANASRAETLLAVCFLDLDGFKPVNDNHGHDTGDAVLIEVAKRLRVTLRGSDTVARLGGDEFVLLITNMDNLDECKLALDRLLASISAPYHPDEKVIDNISASIGVAIFPHNAKDADTLLRLADQSMYIAKRRGKNRYHIFDAAFDRANPEQ